MDKQTLSNYGWIVIAVLVLCVMIAIATPFGQFIEAGIRSTTQGLFDVEQNALGAAGMVIDGNSFTDSSDGENTPTQPEMNYIDFEVTKGNRHLIGYTGATGENLVIPATFHLDVETDGYAAGDYKVTSIDSAFYKCTSLTSVVIPDSVETIGSSAFYETSLTSVVIPDSVKSIGNGAFGFCKSLTSVVIGNSVESIDSNAFYECTSLTSVVIGDSVTYIGQFAFLTCTKLTSINIPDSVTFIGNRAFYECTNLTSITFENPDGWWYANSADATSGTSIDVTDPTTNATNLKTTYYNKYFKRS